MGDDEESPVGAAPLPVQVAAEDPDGTPVATPEIVFESISVVDGSGKVVSATTTGELTREQLYRVGRPWSYYAESQLYHEQAWSRTLEDGTMEHGYRVLRSENPTPVVVDATWGPPSVSPSVIAQLSETGSVRVFIKLRNFPDWDVPLRPSTPLAAADLAAYADEREAALEARELLAAEMCSGPIEDIEAHGGEVIERGPREGWIIAELGAAALAALEGRADILAIHIDDEGGDYFWSLGSGGTDARMGWDRFTAQGYTGERANPNRHSYNDITIAVSDSQIEDEGCFLKEGICSFMGLNGCLLWDTDCSGATRIQERIDCSDLDLDGINCETYADLPDVDGSSAHGTFVTSVALADYSQDQCGGFFCGDSSTSHTSAWTTGATGVAPEARLISIVNGNESNWWKSLFSAQDRSADIFNGSWGTCIGHESNCNIETNSAVEIYAENAFDDGVFVVFAAGNNRMDANGNICGSGTCQSRTSTCGIASPADTPKVFAVNAFDGDQTACAADYNDCLLDTCDYRRGGLGTYVNGVWKPGAVSGIALLGPNGFTHTTNEVGSQGMVNTISTSQGTSAAAPAVAGMAALVKDQYLAVGNTWVNNPGWMNVIMLAMGDRAYEPTPGNIGYLWTGSDPEFGFGRIRMRLFGTGGGLGAISTAALGMSFTSGSSAWSATLWPTPTHSSTSLVKCVLFQQEDMWSKWDISDLELTVKLSNPTAGSCSTLGSQTSILTDNAEDTKSMVRLQAPATTVSNRCVTVTVTPTWVHSGGIDAKLFCYSSTVADNAAPS